MSFFKVFLLSILLFFACSQRTAILLKKTEIDSKARNVAVLPLVNLTSYPNAGKIVSDIFSTELYAKTNFKIMERSEMYNKLKENNDSEFSEQMIEQKTASEIGNRLGVNTIIFGTVTEYWYKRGLNEAPVVGITLRMLDIDTNEILWAESQALTGDSFFSTERSLDQLTQIICNKMVSHLIGAVDSDYLQQNGKSYRKVR